MISSVASERIQSDKAPPLTLDGKQIVNGES